MTWENDEMTVYEADDTKFCPISQDGGDTGDIGLPKSNAYANEIRYFADCVKAVFSRTKLSPRSLKPLLTC